MGVISLELFCVIDYLWTYGRKREVQRAIYQRRCGRLKETDCAKGRGLIEETTMDQECRQEVLRVARKTVCAKGSG